MRNYFEIFQNGNKNNGNCLIATIEREQQLIFWSSFYFIYRFCCFSTRSIVSCNVYFTIMQVYRCMSGGLISMYVSVQSTFFQVLIRFSFSSLVSCP